MKPFNCKRKENEFRVAYRCEQCGHIHTVLYHCMDVIRDEVDCPRSLEYHNECYGVSNRIIRKE